jgi:hypothetical protein
VDRQNRVWVGTLNHGVSVWNGQQWRNYNGLKGTLGERIFDIEVCPTDGDVWIATNVGLTRYSVEKDRWSHITTRDGLPTSQIQALAFDKQGNLVVATQNKGVALAQASDGYKSWRVVEGAPETPTTPTGKGLPTSRTTDVLVSRAGLIYVGTTTGLAWSNDQGKTWSYVRGQDYAAKVNHAYSGAPKGWVATPGAVLAEDSIVSLSEDKEGRLWIGHDRHGVEVVEVGENGGIKRVVSRERKGIVRSILIDPTASPLLASYQQGLARSISVVGNEDQEKSAIITINQPITVLKGPAKLPSPASAPSLDELNILLAGLANIPADDGKTPFIEPLTEDWKTQGDWLGRYGRYWANLCAIVSPANYIWGAGWEPVQYHMQISPKEKKNSLRYWVHWLSTDNPRVLEMPPVYLDSRIALDPTVASKPRRQAEVDDNGEELAVSKNGPNIYVSLDIPDGLWTLLFYNHNKDGNSGYPRDYQYTFKPHVIGKPLRDIENFDRQPVLLRMRQRDFRGGVYMRTLVRGPQKLVVEVERSHAINAILAGVFLDAVDEEPAPYFSTPEQWKTKQAQLKLLKQEWKAEDKSIRVSRFAAGQDSKEVANRLFLEIERLRSWNPVAWAKHSRPIYSALAQFYLSSSGLDAENQNRLSTCQYHLGDFEDWENKQRERGLKTAREIEKSLRLDQETIKRNKGKNFSGRGYQTIQGHLSALTTSKDTLNLGIDGNS